MKSMFEIKMSEGDPMFTCNMIDDCLSCTEYGDAHRETAKECAGQEPEVPASDKRLERGFSLIEAMISALILVVGLVAVATLFGTAVSDFTYSRSQSMALPAAQQELERLVSQYRMGTALTSSSTPIIVSYRDPTNTYPVNKFQVSWTVTNLTRGAQELQVTSAPVKSDDSSIISNLKPTMNKVVVLRTILAPTRG